MRSISCYVARNCYLYRDYILVEYLIASTVVILFFLSLFVPLKGE